MSGMNGTGSHSDSFLIIYSNFHLENSKHWYLQSLA